MIDSYHNKCQTEFALAGQKVTDVMGKKILTRIIVTVFLALVEWIISGTNFLTQLC